MSIETIGATIPTAVKGRLNTLIGNANSVTETADTFTDLVATTATAAATVTLAAGTWKVGGGLQFTTTDTPATTDNIIVNMSSSAASETAHAATAVFGTGTSAGAAVPTRLFTLTANTTISLVYYATSALAGSGEAFILVERVSD